MTEYTLYKMYDKDTVENMFTIKANNDYMAKMTAKDIIKQSGGYKYELYNRETNNWFELYL